MWELDHKESWVPKNWCLWTVLEKTLESPLDCKEIQPVHPKGDQSWIYIGRTDAEAVTPILWPPDAKNWLIGKDPDARWERLKAGEGDDRGWDGWMASSTEWTWVWVNSGSWWWTGRHGVPWFMGSPRVGHDWATELIWTYVLSMFQEYLELWMSNEGKIQDVGYYPLFMYTNEMTFWHRMRWWRENLWRWEENYLENCLANVCFEQGVGIKKEWSQREEETEESPLPHQGISKVMPYIEWLVKRIFFVSDPVCSI